MDFNTETCNFVPKNLFMNFISFQIASRLSMLTATKRIFNKSLAVKYAAISGILENGSNRIFLTDYLEPFPSYFCLNNFPSHYY